jgi:hypothetical protein
MRCSASRYAAVAILVALPGCSANPAYVPVFQEFTASVRRATGAMNGARDATSLKKAVEELAKEAETIDALRKRLTDLGKPNSASKKAVREYLDEINDSLEKDVTQASEHFGKVIGTARVSNDDRLAYGIIALRFGKAVEQFALACRPFD